MTIQIQTTGPASTGAPATVSVGTPAPNPGLPVFEKVQVGKIVTKVSGATAVDSFDEVISLDDRIRVVGEFRVVGVSHQVQKDGSIARIQVVAPCGDLELVPWDPTDPGDRGIIHARP